MNPWPRVCLALLCLFTFGCGYHTAGHAVLIPDNVQSIAIPTFVNDTQTFKIEQMLTSAVVREMTTRTHYRVLTNSSPDADATNARCCCRKYPHPRRRPR